MSISWQRNLEISNDSTITAESLAQSEGNAGAININLSGDILITQGGKILVNTASDIGSGGAITIEAKGLSITEGGIIGAGTSAKGNAGSVNINVSELIGDTGAENNEQ